MSLAALLLAATITVHASPETIWIVREDDGQTINFDLIVDNPFDEPIDLDEVQVSVLDRAGKLVVRRFIDGNGVRPSIRTADVPQIAAKSSALIFNPFHRFDRTIEIHTMRFDLKLSSKDGKQRYAASVDVKPQMFQPRTRLVLPVAGRMIVYDGHDFYAHHRRWDYVFPPIRGFGFRTNFMRYSYDFVPVDEDGNMAKGDESVNENWLAFGKPIRAVADGEVVAVRDDQPDDRKFDPSTIATDGPMKIWGNYVVIRHAAGEFGLYGHIRQGSARVKAGQRVRQGEVVAAIGASGSSMFPHLHFEMQTGPDTNAEGVPSAFENFDRVRGSRRVRVKSGHVNSGEIVFTSP